MTRPEEFGPSAPVLPPLATALRGWRDRTDPAAVGLARNAPRRAPGLRREELALLAGISIDCDVLATQRSDLRVVVFTPQPDSDARSRLDLLATLGTQTVGHPT